MAVGPSKTERRQQRLAAAREEAFQHAVTTPRPLSAHLPSVGIRIVQVARMPAFDLARCFEICEGPSTAEALEEAPEASLERGHLRLRLAVGDKPGSKLVVGSQLVAAPEALLAEFCARFARVRIATVIAAPAYFTADGVRLHLTVASGQAEATFRWAEDDAPAQWAELAELATEFLQQCDRLLGSG